MENNNPCEYPDDLTLKFASAGYQIRQATLGHTESIACPYCRATVILGVQTLCCDPMGKATETVLNYIETEIPRNYDDPTHKKKTSLRGTRRESNRLVPITSRTTFNWAPRIQQLVERSRS